ncbi:MAG: hypothetical protein VB063_05095 [Bacteroides graminisolvens]|jgi:hypothetical protein|uniref:hypothetical protein n=1 Tax=Bacteroides sp. TaxID=29523 RepID=UPI001B5D3130|nr:hypothetical protein [Bacteroides sp.]MEA4886044.1 hypothetical protein [Bacteroides graminisolvens]MBP6248767.1 hypothetical protein [Bacteroides sp.]MBP9553411.1 hypothetical protein [Bacteroides sp.]MBP9720585.1 hypothetical protein [Bacteroides sp.]
MPYRRLPNTDQARIRAMEKLLEKVGMISVSEMAVSLNTISKIRGLLNRFRRLSEYYKDCFDNQSKASRKHQENTKLARLYISHFIQVLNLAALRMEIKPAQKNYYGLQPNVHNVPDLISETALMEWGEKIIVGEMKRTSEGGIPIYNPTIAKVKVRYDIFVESNERQKNLQRLTAESLEDVTLMRPQVDELILDAWNQIEDYYKDMPDVDKRLDLCREYGIVYYYRAGEKKD